MVVDTSAILAVLFNEKQGPKVAEIMEASSHQLRMSTVNLAETLILLEDRQPQLFEELKKDILSLSIRFVSPSVAQAEVAAAARLKYPLNLGDCFAYALSKEEDCPILTLDLDFKRTDRTVIIP